VSDFIQIELADMFDTITSFTIQDETYLVLVAKSKEFACLCRVGFRKMDNTPGAVILIRVPD